MTDTIALTFETATRSAARHPARTVAAFAAAFALPLMLAAPALAQSVSPVATGDQTSRSVVTIGCAECPPPVKKTGPGDYVVQQLEPGTQRVEIREIDGKKKVVRTEAWMGGSPIVFISTLMGDDPTAKADATTGDATSQDAAITITPPVDPIANDVPIAETAPILDQGTTSAVNAGVSDAAKPVFDPDALKLR